MLTPISATPPIIQERLLMCEMVDKEGWNALHFASKSGVLGEFPWATFNGLLPENALSMKTTPGGYSLLHFAVWNGRNKALEVLLSDDKDHDGQVI